jgi:peptidoglycan/xylan/chitin deacetylase (PgdA/CDA1 family)
MQFAVPLLLQERLPFTYFVSTNHVFGNRPFPHDVAAGHALAPNPVTQLRGLAAAGVEIGTHNRNHVHLGVVSAEVMQDEIVGSKHDLEQALEREVRYFAFPYGQPSDLSTAAFQLAFGAGYHGVCSAYGGYNFPGEDPFHLRRIHADCEMVRMKNWLTVDPRKLRRPIHFDPGDFRHAIAPPILLDAAILSSS